MKTNTPKKQTRTIRTTVPRSVYARLAFSAAEEGVTVSQFVYVAILSHIAGDRMAPLGDMPAALAGAEEVPAEIEMPGGDNYDADPTSGPNIPDLL